MDDLEQENLNEHLRTFSYVNGYIQSDKDWQVLCKLNSSVLSLKDYPYIARWRKHLNCLKAEDTSSHCEENIPQKLQASMVALAPNEESGDAADRSLPQLMLDYLNENNQLDTNEYANQMNFEHQRVVGAMKSLQANEELIVVEDRVVKKIQLTAEGEDMAKNGSYEAKVFNMVGESGILQADVMKTSYGKVGVSKAIAAGWITVEKKEGSIRLVQRTRQIEDKVQKHLNVVAKGVVKGLDAKEVQELKKRKLISEINLKSFVVKKGSAFTANLSKPDVDLTADMISSGSWKTKTFKKYNFDALGLLPSCGHLHPLMKVRSEFRQIFFQMGFVEMPTNRYVESSFWNFDALFQPQQHPARDAHDTFFVSDPVSSYEFPDDYLERVKKVHTSGGYGSKGYNYEWKLEEAQKNVLRTHTTAVSARQLYKLAQEGFKPTKMFSIDRVFRNETLDATHLAEFHQVEGVIAEEKLSLSHVMGLFTEFFRKCGITNLRFKPTYNPYTEPSMEIFAYHKGLKKWVEIGNSGMFRPEMLLPMGLPSDVNVAGYGLSLERPTMIRCGINNIRDLFGPKVDLEMIYNDPMCRLDKS